MSGRFIEREDHIEREDFDRLLELVRRAVNLITDDYKDAPPESAPNHFAFVRDAAQTLIDMSERRRKEAN
jgi:hypothetical protein